MFESKRKLWLGIGLLVIVLLVLLGLNKALNHGAFSPEKIKLDFSEDTASVTPLKEEHGLVIGDVEQFTNEFNLSDFSTLSNENRFIVVNYYIKKMMIYLVLLIISIEASKVILPFLFNDRH